MLLLRSAPAVAIVIGNKSINHGITSSLLQISIDGCVDHISIGVGVAAQSLDGKLACHFSDIVCIHLDLQAIEGCNIGAGYCLVVGGSINHVER